VQALRSGEGSAFSQLNVSMANPRYFHPLNGVLGGNNAFVSQVDWLRGLNCSRHTLHILCTERFDADWASLVRGDASSAWRDVGNRSKKLASSTKLDASILSSANREFVRRCIFPLDTRLHAQVCSSRHF